MRSAAALALLAIGATALAGCAAEPSGIDAPSPGSAAAAAGAETLLDTLHRAAAEGDAATYFALFAPEAVFLGTDASERWSIEEFREYSAPYFERGSAWTYRPRVRHLTPLPGGETAFFDELLDHERYGECRGTGVLRRVDGAWRIAQYHLTFPIPNDVAEQVTAFIRGGGGSRWVFVVRHAEKEAQGEDPPLSPAGRARAERLAMILADAPIAACIATEYRRCRETVEPAARAAEAPVETIAARDLPALLARLDALPGGSAALVAGHSNTVPALLAALGVEEEIAIGESSYGELFALRRSLGGVELLRLRF